MKFLKYAVVLPLALSFMGVVQAESDTSYTVPFHNVEVKVASKINVDYYFDPHLQTLVCTKEQNDAITSLEWVYKGVSRKLELPVTLKDDARFEGYYVDPDGKLVITNDSGYQSIFVSCEYRNMQ